MHKVWMCQERMKKGGKCKGRIVKETELIKEICTRMGWPELDEGRLEAEVKRVDVTAEGIEIKEE